MKKIKTIILTCTMLCALFSLNSCGEDPAVDVSPTDVSEVSSEIQLTAEEAVTVISGEQEVQDCFVLKSVWYGEEFEDKSSLNQLMIEKYMSDDSVIPQAADKCTVSFIFNGDEKPSSVKLTQYANTFKANTGIPYNIKEIELQQNENGEYCFEIDFGSFKMYYYQLDCEWGNGNSAQYVFALEKSK